MTYLIQGKTLKSIGDRIRNAENTGYSFDPEIGENGRIYPGAVTTYYVEFIDHDEMYGNSGLRPNPNESDVFVAYGFEADNNGKRIPVIYKTDINHEGLSNIPDYADKHFYAGTAQIYGTTYDKWRKIERDSGELDWDSSAKKYVYTNVIVAAIEEEALYFPPDIPDKIDEIFQYAFDQGYNHGYNEGYGFGYQTGYNDRAAEE